MKRVIFISILIFLLLLSGYIYWFFFNVFADGYRDGILIKFSTKGNIFKTHEGELVQPGLRSIQGGAINTNNFYFSVIDDSIKNQMDQLSGKTIKVHYIQFRKSLPWRGDNYNGKNQENGQYIIDRIEKVSDQAPQIGL